MEKLKEKIFRNIIGLEDVKEKLMKILEWCKKVVGYSSFNSLLPKGILLYGVSGCGKTLLMEEYSKAFNYPTYTINGNRTNKAEDIINVFKKARSSYNSLVLIDKLDTLIESDLLIKQTIHKELDMSKDNQNVIVIATANQIDKISKSFKRFENDKIFHIDIPSNEDIKKLLKYFLNNLKVNINNININSLANLLSGSSGIEIKEIIEDAYILTNGNLKTESIEESYFMLHYGNKYSLKNFNNKYEAIHEAGHVLLSYKHKYLLDLYRDTIQKSVSEVNIKWHSINERKSIKLILAKIEISVAGYLAQKIVYNYSDKQSLQDINKAKYQAKILVNKFGYKGFMSSIKSNANYKDENNNESEKEVNKLIERIEKKTSKYINKYNIELLKISKQLELKGYVSENELEEIMYNN